MDARDQMRRYEALYRADTGFERELSKARQRLALEVVERRNPADVVEIGCGTDPFYEPALGLTVKPRRWVIVEPGESFAEIAESARSPQIELEVITDYFERAVERVAAAVDGSPDLTLCFGVLQSVENPADWLRSVRSSLRPGDALLLGVANAFSFHRRLARIMGLIDDERELSDRDRRAVNRYVFSADDVRSLVSAAGFAVVDSGGYLLKPFTNAQMDSIREALPPDVLDGLWSLGRELPDLASEIYVVAEAV